VEPLSANRVTNSATASTIGETPHWPGLWVPSWQNFRDQWLAADGLVITHDDDRESIASRGSTLNVLSAHNQVDAGEDALHLLPRHFPDSLSQLLLIDSDELRHICYGIAIKSGVLSGEQHIARSYRPTKIACQDNANDRGNLASVEGVRLKDDYRPTVARG
jgi:hypothetical protein